MGVFLDDKHVGEVPEDVQQRGKQSWIKSRLCSESEPSLEKCLGIFGQTDTRLGSNLTSCINDHKSSAWALQCPPFSWIARHTKSVFSQQNSPRGVCVRPSVFCIYIHGLRVIHTHTLYFCLHIFIHSDFTV